MEALAKQHSLRPDAGQNGGHIHLSEGEEEPWGALYTQVQKAQTGELIGPLEVEGKFGIFRVESSDSARALPLDKIKDLSRFKIKKSKEKVAFEAYIAGLRTRYQDQVRWHDQRIAAVHLAETQ
jgi:hypothetical protein